VNYLTPEQILFLQSRLIVETGGHAGWRVLGLLQSAAGRPQATFGGEDLYPDLYRKAAALLDSLVRNHPFVDGNKRVGIAAAALFLRRHGRRLTASNPELERFTLRVTEAHVGVPEIAAWLEAHSEDAGDRRAAPL
jgi:death-on-curing protein